MIAKVIGISPQNTVAATTAYDPTCGSGSLLLKVAAEAGKGGYERRPDLVLYLNGVAIAVIELKRSSVEVADGIRQLITNQEAIFNLPFFPTVQLLLAGNDAQGLRYGTVTSREEFFVQWKAAPLCALIHKFDPADLKGPPPPIHGHFYVFVDECHRTQGGDPGPHHGGKSRAVAAGGEPPTKTVPDTSRSRRLDQAAFAALAKDTRKVFLMPFGLSSAFCRAASQRSPSASGLPGLTTKSLRTQRSVPTSLVISSSRSA